jgi:hypothetical protein
MAIVPVKERGKPTAASKCPLIFESTSDPDYQILLEFARTCQAYLQTDPRWYMPGFKPHEYYVREMIRYGILPETFKAGHDPFDPYATDRNYFESLWHHPNGGGPEGFGNPKVKEYYLKESCEIAGAAPVVRTGVGRKPTNQQNNQQKEHSQ